MPTICAVWPSRRCFRSAVVGVGTIFKFGYLHRTSVRSARGTLLDRQTGPILSLSTTHGMRNWLCAVTETSVQVSQRPHLRNASSDVTRGARTTSDKIRGGGHIGPGPSFGYQISWNLTVPETKIDLRDAQDPKKKTLRPMSWRFVSFRFAIFHGKPSKIHSSRVRGLRCS